MTGSPEHDMRADALLVPLNVTIADARSAALFLAGRARHAAELRDWLEMLGLIAAKRDTRPPRGCITTHVPYERPGR